MQLHLSVNSTSQWLLLQRITRIRIWKPAFFFYFIRISCDFYGYFKTLSPASHTVPNEIIYIW